MLALRAPSVSTAGIGNLPGWARSGHLFYGAGREVPNFTVGSKNIINTEISSVCGFFSQLAMLGCG